MLSSGGRQDVKVCAAPYGYRINKYKEFEIVPTEADIVRLIFNLYNNEGWGYKRISNYLTEQGIPNPQNVRADAERGRRRSV